VALLKTKHKKSKHNRNKPIKYVQLIRKKTFTITRIKKKMVKQVDLEKKRSKNGRIIYKKTLIKFLINNPKQNKNRF
jgi:hypothetical protein